MAFSAPPAADDASMKETEALEDRFFDRYWPTVGAQAGDQSRASTALPSTAGSEGLDDRDKKSHRTDWGKGNGHQHNKRGDKRQADAGSWRRSKDQEWDEWTQHSSSKTQLEKEVKLLRAELFTMQELLLRHEDFLAGLKAELTWVMFFRVDMKATVVPALFGMQQKWREVKEKTPHLLKHPKRVDLIRALFKELSARLIALPDNDEFQQTLKKLGWYEPDTKDWG